jgi:predicted RNA binding protein YcfA (HicA-like mRNA interferase family)
MPKYPVLKPDEVIKALRKLGFQEVRQKGSHKQFTHPDGRFTTITYHKGRDISPILLRKIFNDIEISLEEFLKALK